MRHALLCSMTMALALAAGAFADNGDYMDEVEHHYVDNNGVKIHYAAAGEGPLVLFIHGWPDFWYSWHDQMQGLQDKFRVVAMDCRGYNESDKPEGAENYAMPLILSDVAAVIKDTGNEKAIVVGHDWGGAIAWQFTFNMPDMVDKLIIVNLPHPKPFSRELANNPQQQANSAYARNFQKPDSHEAFTAEGLASIVSRGDEDMKAKYLEAFENSSFDAMMNYYRMNYPKEPYMEMPDEMVPDVNVPVLQFHGLNDTALLHSGLNRTWEYIDADYTLVTIPGVGHWAQHEAADLVTDTMRWWLLARQ